jgi:hypothetical protein
MGALASIPTCLSLATATYSGANLIGLFKWQFEGGRDGLFLQAPTRGRTDTPPLRALLWEALSLAAGFIVGHLGSAHSGQHA